MTSIQKRRNSFFTQGPGLSNKSDLFDNILHLEKTMGTSVINTEVLDPEWVTGFVDGEGCIHVGISKNNTLRLGQQVLPEFVVVQHIRDVQILERLKAFFKCGVVRVNNGNRMAFRVRDFSKLCTTIIPFFQKHPLQTKKARDFMLFREVLLKMQKREHLCEEGIEKIQKLANLMNRKGHAKKDSQV